MPFYSKRSGEYVYDVTIAKDETVRLTRRYCAHLSHAERLEGGRLAPVCIDVSDAYGSTVSEAIRALDASVESWRLKLTTKRPEN
jgi:hypothetical protein